MLEFLVHAILIGFSIAAPVGPIGVICIRRTLSHGRAVGLACGLGAATADAAYGLLGALGIESITHVLVGAEAPLRICGALFLFYLGFSTATATPTLGVAAPQTHRPVGAWASTFFLTLANPLTIASFLALFTTMTPPTGHPSFALSLLFAGGVFCGSAAWWIVLSGAVHRFRSALSGDIIRGINRIAGMILIGFAVLGLFSHAAGPR